MVKCEAYYKFITKTRRTKIVVGQLKKGFLNRIIYMS